jgi:uncharacterized protein (TIGR01777 family)
VRVAVAGASGFVGRHLCAALSARGDGVVPVSLRDARAAAASCGGVDAVVNLAGEPVAQRWTAAAKERIRSSRIDATHALIAGLRDLTTPPRVYVSASAVGYYGTSETETFVEASPPGDDFLARVCAEWETAANGATSLGARVAIVRTGIALGRDGGALQRLLPIFKLGLGGPIAGGKQWYSWVHIDDLVGIYLLALDGGSGPYNATAPAPERNAAFSAALGRVLNRPAFLAVPAFALRVLFGDGADPIVTGQRAMPERAEAAGYRFMYPTLDAALRAIVR